MRKDEIINQLFNKFDFLEKYLEIGTSNGYNFLRINAPYKIGIDPDPGSEARYCGHPEPPIVPGSLPFTSDEFFKRNEDKFDVIFIDGLHEEEQAYRDIQNACDCLKQGGFIVVHDCLPPNEGAQIVPRQQIQWTGNTWKAFTRFRNESYWPSFVIDTDYGVGIIRNDCRADETEMPFLKSDKELTWQNFCKHKERWLNIKSVEGFRQWLVNEK